MKPGVFTAGAALSLMVTATGAAAGGYGAGVTGVTGTTGSTGTVGPSHWDGQKRASPPKAPASPYAAPSTYPRASGGFKPFVGESPYSSRGGLGSDPKPKKPKGYIGY